MKRLSVVVARDLPQGRADRSQEIDLSPEEEAARQAESDANTGLPPRAPTTDPTTELLIEKGIFTRQEWEAKRDTQLGPARV